MEASGSVCNKESVSLQQNCKAQHSNVVSIGYSVTRGGCASYVRLTGILTCGRMAVYSCGTAPDLHRISLPDVRICFFYTRSKMPLTTPQKAMIIMMTAMTRLIILSVRNLKWLRTLFIIHVMSIHQPRAPQAMLTKKSR